MDNNVKISLFSFFSGIGIMDLAFEKCKYDVVFVNEYNDKFMEAYKHSRAKLEMPPPIYGYSTKSAVSFTRRKNKQRLISMINSERQKGNIVGFIGGPPCPDFSVGGKNKGAEGKNGQLTKTYFDLICRCKPDFFVFENVKGLISTEKHRSFYKQMKIKAQKNEYVISDEVVNALCYGVPQFRERIMMIGLSHRILPRTKLNRQSLNAFNFPWDKYSIGKIDDILNLPWPAIQPFKTNSIRKNKYQTIESLTVDYWFKKNKVNKHPNRKDKFTVKAGKQKIESISEGDTKGKSFKRLHRWRYSPTAAYGHNEVHLHPYKCRRLSVAEALAIQSLPEDFEVLSTLPLSSKFKMVGNGVPYLLAEAIAKTLYDELSLMSNEGLLWNIESLPLHLELLNTLARI